MARPCPPEFARAARTAMERCDALAARTDEPGRVTRSFLSPATRGAHDLVREWMERAGLAVRVDAVGNIVGRKAAATPDAPVLAVGSHLDTVPNAGRYDGILGVVLAIAAAELLRGEPLPFHLDAIAFSEEEGVRFRTPFLGSRAMAGTFEPEFLALRDRDGVSVAQAIERFGLDPARIPQAAYAQDDLMGFFEIHIEQGPVLEARDLALGIVSAISGQTRVKCAVDGKARHAGTTPMDLRHDALAGAAEMVLAVERLGREGAATVATVGALAVDPNASNVVPGHVGFYVDVRDLDDARRAAAVDAIVERCAAIAASRALGFHVVSRRDTPSVPASKHLTDSLAAAVAKTLGASEAFRLPSGAGHDAMIKAEIAPMAMLFVRCRDGISHHPDESVRQDDIALAIAATCEFVRGLAS